MKLSLFLVNGIFITILLSACSKKTPGAKPSGAGLDSLNMVVDTLHHPGEKADSATLTGMAADTLSKNEKYSSGKNHKHEAPKHNSPDQMKTDTIKKSKDKKKKD